MLGDKQPLCVFVEQILGVYLNMCVLAERWELINVRGYSGNSTEQKTLIAAIAVIKPLCDTPQTEATQTGEDERSSADGRKNEIIYPLSAKQSTG